MSNQLNYNHSSPANIEDQYVTFFVGHQMFGIPIMSVRDIFQTEKVTKIPLSSEYVFGAINLRGHIITSLDLNKILKVTEDHNAKKLVHIVVIHGPELYSFVVDKLGEVLNLDKSTHEESPGTLNKKWRDVSKGVHKLDGKLLVVLDLEKVFDINNNNEDLKDVPMSNS